MAEDRGIALQIVGLVADARGTTIPEVVQCAWRLRDNLEKKGHPVPKAVLELTNAYPPKES